MVLGAEGVDILAVQLSIDLNLLGNFLARLIEGNAGFETTDQVVAMPATPTRTGRVDLPGHPQFGGFHFARRELKFPAHHADHFGFVAVDLDDLAEDGGVCRRRNGARALRRGL